MCCSASCLIDIERSVSPLAFKPLINIEYVDSSGSLSHNFIKRKQSMAEAIKPKSNKVFKSELKPSVSAPKCSVFRYENTCSASSDIDGIRELVSGSLLHGNNIISSVIIPTPIAIACYMGHEWELSFHLGMRPWIAVAYSTPVAALRFS
ncbi:hypothetical protein ZIOFF_006535 [Zingiber officinale]|uniref:Uncharacterized protein n=1 Tax=Zingiber officinale TaxID=94328 RepID=A0A8J5HZH7_ZINOF|nr:hypothetical protein ZIOFF_006535 [Zingiber officinale]